MNEGGLSGVSLWSVSFCTVALVFLSLYGGQRLGRLAWKHNTHDIDPPFGIIVLATLMLLAFMLALTFDNAATRFETNKQRLVDQVNAIQTAYLKADFLTPVDRDQSQTLLRDYVQMRASVLPQAVSMPQLLMNTEVIHQHLWAIATTYPQGETTDVMTASYVAALNLVFDLHKANVSLVLRDRLHPAALFSLLLLAFLAMASLGFQFGYQHRPRKPYFGFLLALMVCGVLLLIEDLDRPAEGFIQADQSPMVVLLKSISPVPERD